MNGFTFDAGALIALERADRRVLALIARARERNAPIEIPAGVLAQAWRNGAKQARLAQFLRYPIVTVQKLDEASAKAVGVICGSSRTHDVVDAHVAFCALRSGRTVVTSDPDDLRRIAPQLSLMSI